MLVMLTHRAFPQRKLFHNIPVGIAIHLSSLIILRTAFIMFISLFVPQFSFMAQLPA